MAMDLFTLVPKKYSWFNIQPYLYHYHLPRTKRAGVFKLSVISRTHIQVHFISESKLNFHVANTDAMDNQVNCASIMFEVSSSILTKTC